MDIFDLTIVAQYFGKNIADDQEKPEINPDVNGDSLVDIEDLNLVGDHFGEKTKELIIGEKEYLVAISSDHSRLFLQNEQGKELILNLRSDKTGAFWAVDQQQGIGIVGVFQDDQSILLGVERNGMNEKDFFTRIIDPLGLLNYFISSIENKDFEAALFGVVALENHFSQNSQENPFREWMFEQLGKIVSFNNFMDFRSFFDRTTEVIQDTSNSLILQENTKQLLDSALKIAVDMIQIDNVETYRTWFRSHSVELESMNLKETDRMAEVIIEKSIRWIERGWLDLNLPSTKQEVGQLKLVQLLDEFQKPIHKEFIMESFGLDSIRKGIFENFGILVLDHSGSFSQQQVKQIKGVLDVMPKLFLHEVRIISAELPEFYPSIKSGQYEYSSKTIYLNTGKAPSDQDTFAPDGLNNHPVEYFSSSVAHELFHAIDAFLDPEGWRKNKLGLKNQRDNLYGVFAELHKESDKDDVATSYGALNAIEDFADFGQGWLADSMAVIRTAIQQATDPDPAKKDTTMLKKVGVFLDKLVDESGTPLLFYTVPMTADMRLIDVRIKRDEKNRIIEINGLAL